MIHDELCAEFRSYSDTAHICICCCLEAARADERDIIRSQAEGVYRVTGNGIIKVIMDYIDKRGKE
jgi:hypothetical protein